MTITFVPPRHSMSQNLLVARKNLALTLGRLPTTKSKGSSSPDVRHTHELILGSPKGFLSPGGRRRSDMVTPSVREVGSGLPRKSKSELPIARVLSTRSYDLSSRSDLVRPPLSTKEN